MAYAFVAALSRNLLIQTFAAGGAVVVVLGVATGALPVPCIAGATMACSAQAHGPALPSLPRIVAAAMSMPMANPASGWMLAAWPIRAAVPTLTRNDVIARTFALLPAQKQAVAVQQVASVAAEPAVRIVPVVTIEAPQVTTVPAIAPAITAPPRVAEAAPVVTAPLPSAAPAAKANGGQSAIVVGAGANVRANPSSGAGAVLFALAGGSRVTIGENRRGWMRITDARGRSGWMYKDFLRLGAG